MNKTNTILNRSIRLLLAILVLLAALLTGGVPLALSATVWQFQIVDSAGSVGWFTSLELDSTGNPVISYYDDSNGDLKLVHCGDATCSGGNSIVTVDSDGNVGSFTSLELDSSGSPVISYYDESNRDLKLVHCGDSTCSSGNSIVTVDSAGLVGLFTSLELDSSGNPVISYYDESNDNLKLVHCGDVNCSSGNSIVTVDSDGNVGLSTSLELDSSGNPVISYQHFIDFNNSNLKLVHCGDATCSSGNSIVTVDSDRGGEDTSLELDSSGNPVISYYNRYNHDLKLAHCGDVNCSSGNSIVTVDSDGNVGSFTSLVLDSSGNPVISYWEGYNGDLKLARLGDVTAPLINPTVTGTLGANSWYVSDVTVNWSVTDEESTITSQSGCDATTINSDTAGTTLTCTATSAGGTASQSVTVQRDATPPVLNPTVSPNPVPLGGNATVTSNASDALSGLASQSCGTIDTSTVGIKTVACTATDNAGNTATVNASYQVIYNFTGFFSPVDNLPVLNIVNAGRAIPVKFSLGGDQGLNILAAGYPKVQQIACDSGAPGDEIEETVNSGNSGLQYDAASGTYTYVWKTQRSWAGTCRQLIVRLADGTDHIANFKFK